MGTLGRYLKGQAAIELLMVVGIALALSLPFISAAQESMFDLRSSSQVVELQNSMDRFENAAKTVNAAGEPARRTIEMNIPQLVSETYHLDNALVYEMRTEDGATNISRQFDFNLAGEVPDSPGAHIVQLRASDGDVEVELR